jgi:hypothetical protein
MLKRCTNNVGVTQISTHENELQPKYCKSPHKSITSTINNKALSREKNYEKKKETSKETRSSDAMFAWVNE